MMNFKYIFSDGYYCYTVGMMDCIELQHEILKHGKLYTITVA